jgi:hypothetical protein
VAIALVGSGAAAAATIGIPTHQAGDLIVISAYRAHNTAPATVPAGWTTIQSGAANTNSLATGALLATGSATTSGTWTNATQLLVAVFRGDRELSFAAAWSSTANNNNNTSVPYPALTDIQSGSTIYRAAARSAGLAALTTAPENFTLVQSSPATPVIVSFRRHDMTGDQQADSVTVTSAAHRAHTVELREQPGSVAHAISASGLSLTSGSAAAALLAGKLATPVLSLVSQTSTTATLAVSEVPGAEYYLFEIETGAEWEPYDMASSTTFITGPLQPGNHSFRAIADAIEREQSDPSNVVTVTISVAGGELPISASGLSVTSGSADVALSAAPLPTNLQAVNLGSAIRTTWQGSSPSYRVRREEWSGAGTPPEVAP